LFFSSNSFQLDDGAIVYEDNKVKGDGIIYSGNRVEVTDTVKLEETFYSIGNCFVAQSAHVEDPYFCNLAQSGCDFGGITLPAQQQSKSKRQFAPDIIVYPGQTRVLTPGIYNKLWVQDRATIAFYPGQYDITQYVQIDSAKVLFLEWDGKTSAYIFFVGTFNGYWDGTGQIRISPRSHFQSCNDKITSCKSFTVEKDSKLSGLVNWESGYYPPFGTQTNLTTDQLKAQLRTPNATDPGLPNNVAIWIGTEQHDGEHHLTFGQLDSYEPLSLVYLDQGGDHLGCIHSYDVLIGSRAKLHPSEYSSLL